MTKGQFHNYCTSDTVFSPDLTMFEFIFRKKFKCIEELSIDAIEQQYSKRGIALVLKKWNIFGIFSFIYLYQICTAVNAEKRLKLLVLAYVSLGNIWRSNTCCSPNAYH